MDIPIKIGHPKKLSGLADNIDDPSFSVAIGMVIYVDEMMRKPRIMMKSHNTNIFGFLGKLWKSIKEMFKL